MPLRPQSRGATAGGVPGSEGRWRVGTVTVLVALFVVGFDNLSFWRVVLAEYPPSLAHLPFLASVSVVLASLFGALLSLFGFRALFKPVLIGFLLLASVTAYFMDAYGTMIDRTMLQNVLETDPAEIGELLSFRLVGYLLFLWLVPALLIQRVRMVHRPTPRAALACLRRAAACGIVGVATIGIFYPSFSFLGRNHREIRYLINPSNVMYALSSQAKRVLRDGPRHIQPVGEDARLVSGWQERGKATLAIVVVGEAARASQFSLFGYDRPTNPQLSRLDTVNFSQVSSCGTATAVSLPCMFSRLGRRAYRDETAKREESLLDVLTRAGVQVFWRDNNSGCKGICKRVPTERLRDLRVPGLCNEETCYDEVLLRGLQEIVDGLRGDGLIVLHQKGSHGPTYHLRVPEEFELFRPVCRTNQLQKCRREEIVNAYDNTILYTDYFLSRVIAFLKGNTERFRTALIYVSDHGESLGEKNLYLHGIPYWIAPDEQTHVPMILWMSRELKGALRIDGTCLQRRSDAELSHDNLFHSVLGLMGVTTHLYDATLDLFSGCRGRPLRADPAAPRAEGAAADASDPGDGRPPS